MIVRVVRTIADGPTRVGDLPASQPPVAPTNDRARLVSGIVAELNGSVRLLRCAATGRLVKQGVSMTHLHVMWLVEEHGELPMSRLADLLDVAVSNATGLVDRMEERDLIERSRVPDDRRVVLVKLTATGRSVLDEIQIMREDLTEAILERLDDGQLERLHASLQDLRAAVRAEAATDPRLFEAYHRHGITHDGGHKENQSR